MRLCKEVEKRIPELTAVPATQLPAGILEHLAGCSACERALSAARLSRGLLAAATDAPEPPAGFANHVMALLAARGLSRPETEMWRRGWGLVPVFAATVAVLLVLIEFQPTAVSGPIGLLPTEGLSAGERIVLEASPSEPDAVLTAVLEGSGI